MDNEVYIASMLFSIIFVFFLLFLKNMKKDQFTHRLFATILFLSSLASLFNLLSNMNNLHEKRLVFLGLSLLSYLLVYFTLFLFFEFNRHVYPNLILFLLNSMLFGIALSTTLVFIFQPKVMHGVMDFFFDIGYAGLGFSVFLMIMISLFQIYQTTREREAIIQAFAALILVTGFMIELFNTGYLKEIFGYNIDLLPIADTVKAIGLLIFLIFYVINPVYLRRVPIETYALLIFSRNGTLLQALELETLGYSTSHHGKAELISALSAVVISYVKEAIGMKEDVLAIKARDRVVLFENSKVIIAFVAKRETKALRKGLINLRKKIDHEISRTMESERLLIEAWQKERIIQVIKEEFPYVKVNNTPREKTRN